MGRAVLLGSSGGILHGLAILIEEKYGRWESPSASPGKKKQGAWREFKTFFAQNAWVEQSVLVKK